MGSDQIDGPFNQNIDMLHLVGLMAPINRDMNICNTSGCGLRIQSQFLLDLFHLGAQLPALGFEALSLSLAYRPVSSPREPGFDI